MPTIEIATIEIPTIDTGRLRLRSFREADTKAGHFPWVEQPHAFREALDAFLAEIPPAE
jgi:pimeloyl-ACP methyl ester carboxylesterase